ncbi:MAG: FtsX-like permease family protein, partial [Anaerolineales bacterium]
MNVIWTKVWFDLWHHKARTLLAVLSIAAGVFAIGAIFGMGDQLLTGMDAAHQATTPSHLNIILRQPIDRDTALNLTKISGIAGVEALNQLIIRYKTAPDANWQSASLVMRDDFESQKYDLLTLKEGQWPEDDNIAVERLSSQGYGIEIGDEIIFEMDGFDRVFPIRGKIRHPFVLPPDFGGQAYFFMDAKGLTHFGIPEGHFFQLYVRVDPYSEDFAQDRATAIKDWLAKQGIGVFLIIYQEPDVHWGRDFVIGINLVLHILAVVSLFASIILVTNTMTALITQQTDQIGVIKAIGGRSGMIVRVYLAGVLVYSLLALVIALPLGVITAFRISQWLLNIFNIDYQTFQFSSRAVILQVLASLAAPLAAALRPILNGAALSVREALASYGLGGNFGSNKFDRAVEQLGQRFLSSLYANALGNMFRRKGRLFLTQLALTSAGAMFLMVMTLNSSLTFTLDNELARRAYDIRLSFLGTQRAERVLAMALRVPGVAEAEPWYSITGTVLREGERIQDSGGLGAELFGVPAGSTMYQPLITRGRWLQPDDRGNVAVISQETADFNNLAIGDVITIDLGERGDSDWQVIGTFIAIAPDPFTTDPIYVPASAVVNATQRANRASQILIRAARQDAASTEAMMQALSDMYEDRQMGINIFSTRTKAQDREFAFNQYGIVISLLLGLAVVMGLVGGIGLMGALSIGVVERIREIGVLRAIGARSGTIMGMFIMEGVSQGLLSWLAATPLALIVARPVSGALGQAMMEVDLDFAFAYLAVATWLVVILVISTLASILPAYNATRISVR